MKNLAETYSCEFISREKLLQFLKEKNIHNNSQLFIQVFFGNHDFGKIRNFQQVICDILPDAQLIGCTTEAAIVDGKIKKDSIIITFTQFKHTHLKTLIIEKDIHNNEYEHFSSTDLKAIILLAANSSFPIHSTVEKLIKNKEVKIAGGIASNKKGAYIFTKDLIASEGIVITGFYNPNLIVHSYDNISWKNIGQRFSITDVNGKQVRSINHMKPIDFFNKYFSKYFTENLPESGMEFPFVSINNGKFKTRFIKKIFDDGTVELNGKILEGEEFFISYADIAQLIENGIQKTKELQEHSIESIYTYCCSSRYRFLKRFTVEEIKNFQELAPTNGFLTFGEVTDEYIKDGNIGIFTCVALAFSESSEKKAEYKKDLQYSITNEMKSRIILTKLMEESTNDLLCLHRKIEYSNQYFMSLFENNTDIVFSTDKQGNFVRINKAFIETFGYEEEEIIGKPALEFVQKKDIRTVQRSFIRTIKGHEQTYQIELPTKKGDLHLFQVRNIPIIVNGETIGIFCFARNITEKMKYQEKIFQLAYYDQSTGLPNREKFTELIKEAIKKYNEFAVMFIDVDRFKMINDSFGHYFGDFVLIELARRLQSILPEGAILARFGGDKFTMLLTKDFETEKLIDFSKKIAQIVSKPIIFDGQEIFITVSMGASFYPTDAKDYHLLLKYADTAMNRGKKIDGTKLMFFSNEMNDQIKKRFELESYLRRAIEKNELFLCYQPFIDLQTNRIIGCEALIRWNHPTYGTISPMEFIPIAEETGLIHDIGKWVLKEACQEAQSWIEQGLGELIISVNISAQQIQHPSFIHHVQEALDKSGLNPKYLHLELTESGMLMNINHTVSVMHSLQKLGVKMSIDDFGTGYSSLSYLRNLPINSLKIDRSFINNLHKEWFDRSLVQAIITIGTGLQMKIVAEGVETLEQIQELKKLNCHYAQGYYIEKPLDRNRFREFIANETTLTDTPFS